MLKNTNYRNDSFGGRDVAIPQIANIGIKILISIFGGMEIDFISVLKKIRNNTENKESDPRGYNTFSYHLLKIISPFKEIKGSLQHGWGKYSIEIENQRIKKVNQNISNLFFDLLIKYIQEKYYKKEVELF